MIHFIQPYDFNLNIGKAYNKEIEPLEGWICLTDQDTLKFEGFAEKVDQIINVSNENMLITCMTNRLRKANKCVVPGMYDEERISKHMEKYNALWDRYGTFLDNINVVPGMFMLFHKSLWEKVKFREDTIKFDTLFTMDARAKGMQIKVAKGLYIFHLYRWGKDDPENYIEHLLKK